jgi:hypothetical protein
MNNVHPFVVLLLTPSAQPTCRELQVAITLAESMIRELNAATSEWEQALRHLQTQEATLKALPVNFN